MNNINKNDKLDLMGEIQSHLVKVRDDVLKDFPLLSLKERDLEVVAPFSFSTLYYNRPIGNSRMASAEVELISPTGDVISEKIYFEFKFTEAERLEDAKRVESFWIRPEILYANKKENFVADDFENKYEDILITKVSPVKTREGEERKVQLTFQFNEVYHKVSNPEKYTVIFPLKSSFQDLELAHAQTETVQINVLKMFDHDIVSGAKLLVADLEHFSISPAFLKSSPPTIVNSSIIIPKPYINLMKIDYIPPKDVDSVEGELLVEYEFNGRIHSDRVSIFFAMTIRQAAEKMIAQEPVVNFVYIPKARRVPPIHMDVNDFQYTGQLPLKIIGVEYNHESVDPDNRFISVGLILRYRTTIIKVQKRLEFKYSRNEYINGSWISAKTENGSIIFDKNFISPDIFYELIDLKKLEFKKPSELVKNASVNPGYPYASIRDIKLINFDPSSRELMFKVNAIEMDGMRKIVRSFEKHEKMPWSYNEWKLGKMEERDLRVNEALVPEFPTYNMDEKLFEVDVEQKIISVQYIYPGDDEKEVEVQVQVATGHRSKFITKKISFQTTYNEYKKRLKNQELINSLRVLKPKDLSLILNINGQPPAEIRREQIVGIPEGVDVKINYKPPRVGDKAARIIIEMKVDKFISGFEQTITFAQAREK